MSFGVSPVNYSDSDRGRVVDSGPRGPGFRPQPGCLSLWPLASRISTAREEMVRNWKKKLTKAGKKEMTKAG